MGLGHHEHHEDGVGGADARKVDEEAPGAQQGHHSCCHLYLGAPWFKKSIINGNDSHRNEDAAKLDGHQGPRDEALQLRREPLGWRNMMVQEKSESFKDVFLRRMQK